MRGSWRADEGHIVCCSSCLIRREGEKVAHTVKEDDTDSKLVHFLDRAGRLDAEFIVWDDGYRGRTYSYKQVAAMANALRARLRSNGIQKGDSLILWSESRPGWVAALWACLLEGVILVPIDPQSSASLVDRIATKARPKIIVAGDRVAAIGAPVWRMAEIESGADSAAPGAVDLSADDVAEIVFTSGTTAEPKGVVITHRNLAAQIRPIEDQIAPYRKYVRPFAPLRILNLLPMSHLFGQFLATIIPPLIPASAVFISSTSPHEIARQIRSRRITILVSLPKVLEVLRDFVVHRFPEAADTTGAGQLWPRRWWRFRAVHRLFGWKFCCLVSGGAPLPADLEQFWQNL